MWDREAGRRRDTTWQDLERWRGSLQSVSDVGPFQTTERNAITPDGSIELAAVAAISAAPGRQGTAAHRSRDHLRIDPTEGLRSD